MDKENYKNSFKNDILYYFIKYIKYDILIWGLSDNG